ncbi:MAG: glycogen debranching enzyme, partial [Lachnospiraceae bacterium]|nr:glycogen debranching enzyme [Lachnospiraceae bacterium]
FAGQEQGSGPEVVYIASNAYWEDISVTLPKLPSSMFWEIEADTWQERQEARPLNDNTLLVRQRSVIVLVGK